jgi:hypothetical protein
MNYTFIQNTIDEKTYQKVPVISKVKFAVSRDGTNKLLGKMKKIFLANAHGWLKYRRIRWQHTGLAIPIL